MKSNVACMDDPTATPARRACRLASEDHAVRAATRCSHGGPAMVFQIPTWILPNIHRSGRNSNKIRQSLKVNPVTATIASLFLSAQAAMKSERRPNRDAWIRL